MNLISPETRFDKLGLYILVADCVVIVLSVVNCANWQIEVAKMPKNTRYVVSVSFRVIEFGTNRIERAYTTSC